MRPPETYWTQPAEGLLHALGTRAEGLSTSAARARLARHGRNAVREEADAPAWRLLVRQFQSPLVLILVLGAVVSLGVGDWADAAIILAIVAFSALLGFTQEHRATQAVAALRRRLALRVRVRRDGATATVDATTLVPGDVVELAAGNLVPADGVVLAARDFLVTEAALTGESFPVEKTPGVTAAAAPLAQRTNCVFLGSSVRSGTATMLVVHTGSATAFGAIASRLEEAETETEFARGVRAFGYLLLRVMVVMVVFVLVVNQALHRPVIDSLLFAMALAVGLSPELLPAIVSVTLARGARAMARQGVLVRRLEAIENLGSIDVLCTDKTGTLTTGTLALAAALDPEGHPSVDVRQLGFLNAAFETGIVNPLDLALTTAGTRAGLATAGWHKVDEIPYDFLRRRLTVVVAADAAPATHRLVTKGAFAQVLAACGAVAVPAGTCPLDPAARARLEALYAEKGREGFRVLAVAVRDVAPRARYDATDEATMTFAGFLLFSDPPKPGIVAAIGDLARLGIAIKVITGDNRHVAAHVARAIGLDPRAMLTGEEIARMRDEALWQQADRADLFVEVDPQQKERIVAALRHRGRAVGYLGDGINDAPSLKAADVGISVEGAVDVARATADIVLLQPDLHVLCRGIEDGRRTFANTLKYIAITTSANFGNMVSMALAAPFLPFLPLVAKQILLNNFLSDLPSMAISTDAVDPERTAAAQRWRVREVRRFMIVFGLVSSAFDLVTFWLLLRWFDADERVFQTAWFVVSLLTELAVVLVLRTRRPAWRSRPSALLLGTTVGVGGLAVALPYLPQVAAAFGFVALPLPLLGAGLAIVAAYVVATEAVKLRFFRAGAG